MALAALCATAPVGGADGHRDPSRAPGDSSSVQVRVLPVPRPGQEATAQNSSSSDVSGDIGSGTHGSSHTRAHGHEWNHHAYDLRDRPGGHARHLAPQGGLGDHVSPGHGHAGHGRTRHGFLPFTGNNVVAGAVTGTVAALMGAGLVWLTRRRRPVRR